MQCSEEYFQGRSGCKFFVNNVIALQVIETDTYMYI